MHRWHPGQEAREQLGLKMHLWRDEAQGSPGWPGQSWAGAGSRGLSQTARPAGKVLPAAGVA